MICHFLNSMSLCFGFCYIFVFVFYLTCVHLYVTQHTGFGFTCLIKSIIFLCLTAGDVVLKDLKLKAEALNALKLPVTVKAGFVGSITLKVVFRITDCSLAIVRSLL